MALSHSFSANNNAVSGTALSIGIGTKPVLNNLLLLLAWSNTPTNTFTTPTDNGSGTGWVSLGPPQGLPGLSVGATQGWYKPATAADVSSLNGIDLTQSSSDAWSIGYDTWTGFAGPATLDLNAQSAPAGLVTSDTIIPAGSPKANEEIAVVFGNGDNNGWSVNLTFVYTPDGGVTNYPNSPLQFDTLRSALLGKWFHPTTGGSSPKFVGGGWPSQHVRFTVATFYDPGANSPQVLIV